MGNRPNVHSIRQTDEDLWQSLKAGGRAALEAIFRRYYGDLYNYGVKLTGRPELVEDHIQDLFFKIWTRRRQLGDISGVKTYLWTALRRRLIRQNQKRSRSQKRAADIHAAKSVMEFSSEELLILREDQDGQTRALKQALSRLSPKRREAIYLKYYEGMSYEEIQEIMEVGYQTARNYIYKALEALREEVEEEHVVGITLAVTSMASVAYLIHLLLNIGVL